MSFPGTVDPAQLKILAAALNEHCDEFGIDKTDAVVREACRIMFLFTSGVSSLAELKRLLREDQLL